MDSSLVKVWRRFIFYGIETILGNSLKYQRMSASLFHAVTYTAICVRVVQDEYMKESMMSGMLL